MNLQEVEEAETYLEDQEDLVDPVEVVHLKAFLAVQETLQVFLLLKEIMVVIIVLPEQLEEAAEELALMDQTTVEITAVTVEVELQAQFQVHQLHTLVAEVLPETKKVQLQEVLDQADLVVEEMAM